MPLRAYIKLKFITRNLMSVSDFDPQTIARTANALIDDHLRAGRVLSFTLATSSMWPELKPGDKATVRAARIDELRLGDILVRREAGSWIAHRLIARASTGGRSLLVTKGDNALTADTPWSATQMVGVVVAVEPAEQKSARQLTQARRRALLIALLSRGQLLVNRVRPNRFRHILIKVSRACLRLASGFAR